MIKAYNYYHGKRDPEQFRHLEENYGIGTPTSVEFVPLVRKHIDVLVGEYLTIPALPKVSCKDSDTIAKITDEKLAYINKTMGKEIQKYFKRILSGETGLDTKIGDRLDEMQANLEDSFISQYEIAAQNVVD
jgi:nucleoid-associated protein YejK